MTQLETRVQSLLRERDHAMSFQQQYETSKKQFHLALQDAEQRIAAQQQQLHAYMVREPALIEENRSLQSRLDRNEIEMKRSQRQQEQEQKKKEWQQKLNMEIRPAGASNTGSALSTTAQLLSLLQSKSGSSSTLTRSQPATGRTAVSGSSIADQPLSSSVKAL